MKSRSDFNEYVDRYDRWYEKNKFAYLSEVAAIEHLMPKSGLGLEVGVGTGRFASVLKIPFGIDLAKRSLKITRRRGVRVVLASGKNLPFKDRVFDYVWMIIALSFFQNPKQALYEVHRILKQEGRIIIGLVDKNSFLGALYQKRRTKGHPFFREVIVFFAPHEVTAHLKECGFKNFEIYQTLFKLPKKIKHVQEPMKGYGKGGFVVVGAMK